MEEREGRRHEGWEAASADQTETVVTVNSLVGTSTKSTALEPEAAQKTSGLIRLVL